MRFRALCLSGCLLGAFASPRAESISRSDLALSSTFLLTSGSKEVGHALLVQSPSGEPHILSAAHVIQQACASASTFSIRSIKNLDQEFVFDCPKQLPDSAEDLFVQRVRGLDLEPSQLAKLSSPQELPLGRSFEGFTLCRGIDQSHATSYRSAYNGKFWVVKGNSRLGCSGSGLFWGEAQVYGVLKGFHIASKNSLYTPVDTEIFSKHSEVLAKASLVVKDVINSGRGDPIDGGNRLAQEYTLVMPTDSLENARTFNFSGFKTSDLIVHTPEISHSFILPKQANCHVSSDGTWISHLRHAEQNISYQDQKSWPFLYLDDFQNRAAVVVHSRYRKGPHFNFTSYSDRKGAHLLEVVDSPSHLIRFETPTSKITLSPGTLQIEDAALSSTPLIFVDPNLCYRAVSIQSQVDSSVVSINISLELLKDLSSKEAHMEMIVSRSRFESLKSFESGEVEELNLYRILLSREAK